ncbi:hypothetical protein CMV30_18745 [Nibricoccus aquaticus]|uniref:Phosphatidylinositol kinase n=1 Tax=Nibricoccus aquaticus TaxID=2576891 RepID=A0A290QBJ9_9BACT|nr:type II toxin-antitoxin system HipA family toxin [Nibricoccus aquaticus]ATC65823.1 hypothetical protein CMV30_18745 [Nibricoccus aquaticus]
MKTTSVPSIGVHWYNFSAVGKVLVPGEPRFAYLPEWLSAGFNLSPIQIPFTETFHRVREKEFDFLPGFLADSIPDQWGQKIMAADLAKYGLKITPLNKLAWVGTRGIGALKFLPPASEDRSSNWESVSPLYLAREAQEVFKKSPPEAFEHLLKAGTAGGAFPKANVALLPDRTLLCGGDVAKDLKAQHPGARLGILKLDSEDTPGRPSTDGRLEYAYLAMARAAGIRTTAAELLSDEEGERVRNHLFVVRFDVSEAGDHRLHLVTLAGLLERFTLTYSNLIDATRRLTNDRREVAEAVRRMIFNARAGNSDDHGKNHSFAFDDRTGEWKLTPAYDLTLNYSEGRLYHGLLHQTFGGTPALNQMRELAGDFLILGDEFDVIDAQVKAAIDRWPAFAADAFLTQAETDRVSEIHRGIAERLQLQTPSRPLKTPRRFR